MVKGSVSSADKAPNSGSKRSLLETFHDEVDETLLEDPDMVVEVSFPQPIKHVVVLHSTTSTNVASLLKK